MITPQELRIGNWLESYMIYNNGMGEISDPGIRHLQVDVKLLGMIVDSPAVMVRPIFLSPDILEKCGFLKLTDHWYYKDVVLYKHSVCFAVFIEKNPNDDGLFIKRIEHLHELQNAIFFLLNEELNYKP